MCQLHTVYFLFDKKHLFLTFCVSNTFLWTLAATTIQEPASLSVSGVGIFAVY